MKVLQTIGGFGALGGGTSTCTYDLMNAIHHIDSDIDVDLLTPDCSDRDKLMGDNEEWIRVVPNDYKTPLALSRNLSEYLKENEYDIYHTNGMWMYVNHKTCSIARHRNKPYIITPHGMLYPEALGRSSWKKWPVRKIWFDRDVRKASCIHVTCQDEMNHIRNLGYSGPVALIANPVNIPEFTTELIANRTYKENGIIKIAFLGRLHPRKKVENILRGVFLSNVKDIEVFIMGKGDKEYEEYLKKETEKLKLQDFVHFLGFVRGQEKFKKLSEMDALFVPSDMENFGMIVPEALIVGTPVMASLGTPWESLNENKCGWWTDNSPESIADVLSKIVQTSPEVLSETGKRGRQYVYENFEANKIGSQMLDLYRWLNNEMDKPEFVDIL